ncbi:hypothetical protein [Paenibacillus qinlingensis]|uniref:Lipoprotein n=1 Tax=Paenibacillus qinlingensis TaxID=1837343 RepID=A0ABU1P4Q0_9BACL|nr:hypothetical protein [Paenibacillus qinlingensis]MDR6554047.1 hypothetical protein [Paenibacillus qinlingensis]
MGKFMVVILTVVFLLAGCSSDEKPNEHNVKELPIRSHAKVVAEGDFVYRLVSEKSVYTEGEKVEVYAELEYVGDEPEIKIAHADSPFYFPMKEKTRNYDIGYGMKEPLRVTVLKKGIPLREIFKPRGGYSSDDQKEYVDYIKALWEASNKGTLLQGDYQVAGTAMFNPLNESMVSQESFRLNAEIEFLVEKPKNKE